MLRKVFLFFTEITIASFEEMQCSVAQLQLGSLKRSSSKSLQLSSEREKGNGAVENKHLKTNLTSFHWWINLYGITHYSFRSTNYWAFFLFSRKALRHVLELKTRPFFEIYLTEPVYSLLRDIKHKSVVCEFSSLPFSFKTLKITCSLSLHSVKLKCKYLLDKLISLLLAEGHW